VTEQVVEQFLTVALGQFAAQQRIEPIVGMNEATRSVIRFSITGGSCGGS
jgi:hypothetical protein